MPSRIPLQQTTIDNELISRVSEAVYRRSLGDNDVKRMIEQDGDDGAKLSRRARSYDQMTRNYLNTLAAMDLLKI